MKNAGNSLSLSTAKDVKRFRKAAVTYTENATKSKKSAREALIKLGIYTEKGHLSKNYK